MKRRRLFSFYFLLFTSMSSDSTWQSVSAIDPNDYSWCRCAVHIEDTAVIEWLLTRPERNIERG